MLQLNKELFDQNPVSFVKKTINEFVNNNPKRHFEGSQTDLLFDELLIGFASGDDPLFQEYKKVIGEFHFTPREIMEKYYRSKGMVEYQQPSKVTVIVWILPIALETRLSLRKETQVPSLRWNRTRWQGEEMNKELQLHLVSVLEGLGYRALAPMWSGFWQELDLSNGPASNWSHRHAAYAAGLGTFSLSDGFITPRGIAIRIGSIICDVDILPSPRPYANHLANCLFYKDKSCRRCIERCPAGAISERGHDKKKCRDFLYVEQLAILKKLGRDEGYIGKYLGCGLCQTKVPCEGGIPANLLKKEG